MFPQARRSGQGPRAMRVNREGSEPLFSQMSEKSGSREVGLRSQGEESGLRGVQANALAGKREVQ